MESRLFGIVATAWLFFTILSLFVALAFSPMGLRLLLPEKHPVTWVYPALLIAPPLIVAFHGMLGPKATRVLLWAMAIALTACAMLLIVFFGAAMFGS
jgi:hypothetical protein